MPLTPKIKKYAGIILLAVFICVLYGYRLSFPPEPYYDEEHYVKFMKRLVHEHAYDYVSTHPPLWPLLTWPFMVLGGGHAVTWRIVSLLAGVLLIPAVYLLAKKISRDPFTALCAAFLFSFDCISLTQARIGMFNSLSLLLMVLSLWALLQYVPDQRWPRRKALFITGVFLGLALSTKLSSFSIVPVIYFLIILRAIKTPAERKALCFDTIVFLAALPLALYFASHIFIAFLPGYSWKYIWDIQVYNLKYHLFDAKMQTHLYTSSWWGWPLLLRPIWFYYTGLAGMVRGIICIGNPVIFWMIPAMTAYLLWDLIRHKRRVSGLIILGFFGQWLFYALGSRFKFFHYFYVAMPFVAIGLAHACRQLWEDGRGGKVLVCLYLALVLVMFMYWYPLLTGLPIPEKFFQQHMWFRSWI